MAKRILIKPIITEKTNRLQEKRNQYAFVVNRDANKLEIRKAVEEYYSVTVSKVNTCVMPAKVKNRSTKRNVLRGRRSPYKKAYVSLPEGEIIEMFGAEDQEG